MRLLGTRLCGYRSELLRSTCLDDQGNGLKLNESDVLWSNELTRQVKGFNMYLQHKIRSGQDRRSLDVSSIRNIQEERRDYSEDRRLGNFGDEQPNANRTITRDYSGDSDDVPTTARQTNTLILPT